MTQTIDNFNQKIAKQQSSTKAFSDIFSDKKLMEKFRNFTMKEL